MGRTPAQTANKQMAEQILKHEHQQLQELLSHWIPTQRWYVRAASESAQAEQISFSVIHAIELLPISVYTQTYSTTLLAIVADTSEASAPRTYAVPLYCERTSDSSTHVCKAIGTITLRDGSLAAVYDAAENPHGQYALLAATLGESFAQLPPISKAKKLTSEQSNTSIIYEFCTDNLEISDQVPAPNKTGNVSHSIGTALDPAAKAPSAGIILKILRLVHDGRNPDVELENALDHSFSGHAQSSQLVPRQYGHLTLTFAPRSSKTSRTIRADISVAAEFLAGSADGWQVVTEELTRTGTSSLSRIKALGTLTKDIHRALADALPVTSASAQARADQLASWQKRASAALDLVPELARHRKAIEHIFTAASECEWPDLQRVHGDYHLGQVLLTRENQWRAIDFEGEPLRPLPERCEPDLALRDVAGMLRSISYAVGYARMHAISDSHATNSLHEWESTAHTAFLNGYGECGYPLLLQALMLDKALYEVAYEAAYRPDWLSIPLQGVIQALHWANF